MSARFASGTRIASLSGMSHVRVSTGLLLTALTVCVAGASSLTGCYATADADVEPAYVEVDTVPVNVETYPTYVYGGRTGDLVDGRWDYRRRPRSVYYRDE